MEENIFLVIFIWIVFTLITITLAFFYKRLSESKPKYSKEYKKISIKQVSYSFHGAQPSMPLIMCVILIFTIFMPFTILQYILILVPFILIQMIFFKIKKILIGTYNR